MFTKEMIADYYCKADSIQMPRRFAFVYSKLNNVGPHRQFWIRVTKFSLEQWYDDYKGLFKKEIKREYRKVKIPKRQNGFRELTIPCEELKSRQRAWLEYLELISPAHNRQFSYAFERRRSVYDALKVHTGNYLFIKCDIKDAFPSVREDTLSTTLTSELPVHKEVARELITDCYYDGLPQGAPSSGKLFNISLRGTDSCIASIMSRVGGKYSRYADDIIISFPKGVKASIKRTLNTIERYLGNIGMRINPKKTRVFRGRAKILGCVVHQDGRITISRKKRRLYRAMIHNAKSGKRFLRRDEINGIKGWLTAIYKDEEVPGVKFYNGVTSLEV